MEGGQRGKKFLQGPDCSKKKNSLKKVKRIVARVRIPKTRRVSPLVEQYAKKTRPAQVLSRRQNGGEGRELSARGRGKEEKDPIGYCESNDTESKRKLSRVRGRLKREESETGSLHQRKES